MPTLVPCTERFSSERVSAKACSHEFFKAAFASRFGQFLHEPAAACATHPVSPESFRGCPVGVNQDTPPGLGTHLLHGARHTPTSRGEAELPNPAFDLHKASGPNANSA